ncbi:MAG: methyltransferase domain-containing protein [Gammaproteobacteria bacterium]|nr:methyltransferase domain-containing protein [Gammaproteobacteria bacterium]
MSDSSGSSSPSELARRELLDRLDHFAVTPKLVVELGSTLAGRPNGLRQKFPRARIVAVSEPGNYPRVADRGVLNSLGVLLQKILGLRPSVERIESAPEQLPFAAASVDVVVADRLLAGRARLDAVLNEVRRVLRPGALFLWSTLAPDSRLQPADADADLVDMHDIGSALGRAGFAEPVLDIDRLGDVEVIQVAAFAGAPRPEDGDATVDPAASDEIFVPVDSIGRRGRMPS